MSEELGVTEAGRTAVMRSTDDIAGEINAIKAQTSTVLQGALTTLWVWDTAETIGARIEKQREPRKRLQKLPRLMLQTSQATRLSKSGFPKR